MTISIFSDVNTQYFVRIFSNVCFAKKFILDALQEMKILKNDGWAEVAGFEDRFYVDKRNPRVEVEIYEEGNEEDEAEQKGTKD